MAAATMYVTVAGAEGKTGADWDNAMGYAEFETDLEGSAEAGDIYYVASGTYTFTSAMATALDGTAAAPISIIGVLDGTTTPATGTDRPLFACGAYYFEADNYAIVENIRFTGTAAVLARVDTGSRFVNCKAENTSETAGRIAFSVQYEKAWAINCECISANGKAFVPGGRGGAVLSYLHDSDIGVEPSNDPSVLAFCIVDSCATYGINVAARSGSLYLNNTIYGTKDGDVGINLNAAYGNVCINNTITHCATGAADTASTPANFWDYNNWYDNTADVSNVTKGANDTAVDPEFTNAASGDFSLAAGSALRDAGMALTLGVG